MQRKKLGGKDFWARTGCGKVHTEYPVSVKK